MLKIITVVLALNLAMNPLAADAQSEQNALPSLSLSLADALAQEPPLSQSDIDAYLEIIPKIPQLVANPDSADQMAENLHLSQLRFSYIMVKIPLIMALASGADPKVLGLESLPKALHPSDSDITLVVANLAALSAAAVAAESALTEAVPGSPPK